MPLDDIRLVIAKNIYNEEQFIYKSLLSQQKILDVDMTYIADGAYNKRFEIPYSTDGTRTITKLFPKIKWLSATKFIDSEAEKRNRLTKWIEQDSKGMNTWVLWIDGDEEILFKEQIYKDQILESLKTIALKPYLQSLDADCDFVIMQSFPQNDTIRHPLEYFQLRLYKAGKGIYWDKTFPNRYVDKNGNVLMDYNEGRWLLGKKHACYNELVIYNKWFQRPSDRIELTQAWLKERNQAVWLHEKILAEKAGQNMFF